MQDEALLQRVQALQIDNTRLRRLLERQGSPTGLRHQVRNTLAMVRDVIRRSAEHFEGAEDYAAHLDGRLDAVFRIQSIIANGSLDGVALGMLVADELLTHAVGEGDRLSIDGPDVLLQPAVAGALALAIHELTTNAVKFGALSSSGGHIDVRWTIEAGQDRKDWLMLRWIETGVEQTATSSPARGFGTEMVQDAIRYQFGGEGTLDTLSDGLRCTIRLPLAPWIGSLRDISTDG